MDSPLIIITVFFENSYGNQYCPVRRYSTVHGFSGYNIGPTEADGNLTLTRIGCTYNSLSRAAAPFKYYKPFTGIQYGKLPCGKSTGKFTAFSYFTKSPVVGEQLLILPSPRIGLSAKRIPASV